MSKGTLVGLAIRPHGLEWTALGPAGQGVQQRKSPPRGAVEPATAATWPELFENQMALEAPLLEGEIHLAIPSDGILLRVLDLPTVEAGEIPGMVELQIDQYSPFPVELLYLSWEILAQKDGHTRVLVAGARRALVDRLGAAAARQHRRIHRIDSDALAWLHLLRRASRIPATGRQLVLLDDAFAPMLVALDAGQPVFFRALAIPPPGAEDREAVLVEEIGYALADIENEWGGHAPEGMLWVFGETPPARLEAVAEGLGFPVSTAAFAALDPLSDGVAQRAGAGLDLSPRAWKDEAASRAQRARALRVAGLAAAVWLTGWGIFLGLLAFRRSGVQSLQKEVESLAKPAEEAKALERELVFLNAFTNRAENVLDSMLEVVKGLPPGSQLSDFQFRKSTGVTVSGSGPSQSVLAYTKGLGESPMFKMDDVEVGNGRFRFNAKLASAVAAEKESRP